MAIRSKNYESLLLFTFLVLPGTLLYCYSRFQATIGFDEGHFLWYGSLILKGQIPYRDFFEPKPPLIFYSNALGLALFGIKGAMFRMVPTLLAGSSVLVFYIALIKEKIIPLLAALITMQTAFWLLGPFFHDNGLNDTETYGLAFCLLGFGILRLANSAKKSFKTLGYILGGTCLGLAIISKELFLLSAVPIWVLSCYDHSTHQWNKKALFCSTLGTALVGFTVLVLLLVTSAFRPYLHLLQFYKTFAAQYCIDLGIFPRVSGFASIAESAKRLNWGLYNISQLQFVFPLMFLALWTHRKSLISPMLILSLFMGCISISVGHCFWSHYYLMGISGLLMPTVFGAIALSSAFEAKTRQTFKGIFFLLIALFIHSTGKVTWNTFRHGTQSSPHFSFEPNIIGIIETYSKPGDTILTTGSPSLYVVTNRNAPFGNNAFLDEVLDYTSLGKTDEEKLSDWREILEKKPPKICHFPNDRVSRRTRHFNSLFIPFLKKHSYQQISDTTWIQPQPK